MPRLIDANALIERCKEIVGYEWNHKASPVSWADAYEQFADDVDAEPAVDAVEVVRCKDCKHYHQYHVGKTNELCEWGKCQLINMDVDMPKNGFCSYGERREGE